MSAGVRGYRIAGAVCLAACTAAGAGMLGAPSAEIRAAADSCVLSQGYWSQHPAAWPVAALTLGNAANPAHTYSKGALLKTLGSGTQGDASLILATQEIAAKLNIAHGSNPAPIASTLTTADNLLGTFPGTLPYQTKPGSSTGAAMVSAASLLEDYNLGKLPNSCGNGNATPVANAGPDQTVVPGGLVTLNGGGSSDADGDALTVTWSFVSKPGSSAAALSDPHAVMPTFVADAVGTYDVQLIVNDGTANSAPDTVRISTQNSRPVANAGPDQSLAVTSVVPLDGSASSDPDGDSLTFSWSFVSIPSGSTATLSSASAVKPTFAIDRPGNYVAQLIVSDGQSSSAVDTVTISTINSAPVANAGPDHTAPVNASVTLNGGGSSDVDGDPLTFAWSFVSRPEGSTATLTNPTSVAPTFALDAAGAFVVQLIVNDGQVNSVADTVTMTTGNSRPVANAGPDQSVVAGATVQLDGSGSTDIDGNALTFLWALTTRPEASVATLSNPAGVRPTFAADVPGDYIAQLVVSDGTLDSAADTVTITTLVQNHPPAADAGPNQTVPLSATVQLDASASSDPDGDALAFKWSLLSTPAGSAAALSNATVVNPTFDADKPGSYVAQLIVNDGTVDSGPRTVTISTENSAPTANAGPNQTVAPNATVQLDASASSDPDGTPVTYTWSLLSAPPGSAAALSNPTGVKPTFVADLEGVYVAQLIVSDGVLFSGPVTVAVTAQNPADLEAGFEPPPANPAVGSTVNFSVRLRNLGPGGANNVTAEFKLPAGYTLVDVRPFIGTGTYDPASGIWAIDSLPCCVNFLSVTAIVNANGPYDLTLNITHSSAPDPDPTNNSATVNVSPNPHADLEAGFEPPPVNPPVGSQVGFAPRIRNLGPSTANNVTAQFKLPAGYTLVDVRPFIGTGTYDPASGIWAIDSLPCCVNFLSVTAIVNPTGPYDLSLNITHSSAPDSDPTNNSATATVTPNPNADLSVEFFNPPSGTMTPGAFASLSVIVRNNGLSTASGITAHFQVPAGYTVVNGGPSLGTYDAATGNWTIGFLDRTQSAGLGFGATVNATGPTQLIATITGSSQPDPDPTNNIAAPPPINRPPIPKVGPDQTAATHTSVLLDGVQSFDPDGDAFTYQWSFALRPVNSLAAIAGGNTATPSFVPDQGGRYR